MVLIANLQYGWTLFVKGETGSWHLVFVAAAIMNLVVVVLALAALKPLRSRFMGPPRRPQLASAD